MAPSDLPDYTRYIAVQVELPPTEQAPMIPRPKGGVKAKGSITTAATYTTVASHVPASGKTFQVSRVIVSVEYASWVKFRWDGADISAELLMDDKTIMILHFPWDYEPMAGDGVKAFDVQAKYYTRAGLCNVEIVGEEE